MALITAKANGNWSAGSTWDSDPALPGPGDTVESAGYTVTIDQDVAVATIRATLGGHFEVGAGRTITANIDHTGTYTGGGVRCVHGSGTVTITGTITQNSATTNAHTVVNSGAGVLNISGSVTGGLGNNSAVRNISTGTINLTGDATAGSASFANGVSNSSTGAVNVVGTVTGGAGTSAIGLYNTGNGNVSATTAAAGSGITAHGIRNDGSTGTAKAKRLVWGSDGNTPIGGYFKIDFDSTANYAQVIRSDTGAVHQLSNDYPTAAQVESGVVFKLGTQTGTLAAGGGRPAFGDRTGGKW